MKKITILGATGSIGINTLKVIACHPESYQVYALTAKKNLEQLYQQCLQFSPRYAVMLDIDAANTLRQRLAQQASTTIVSSSLDDLQYVASSDEVDYVMAAIVGAAGLLPSLAAARAGKRLLLANKEALVMAGNLFMQAVAQSGAELLPIDSEHNAIFQCLPNDKQHGVQSITLTASGGPFLDTPLSAFSRITPAQAVAHPNWSMGQKISVDSASMMNKGLEVIEAFYLFNKIAQVCIHPQSIVHSMVSYIDGSVLAQMGNPDMRTPIAHALAWPQRIQSGVAALDLIAAGRLDFRALDKQRFPCLDLAYQALASGNQAPTVLNAANEIAVMAFLQQQISFPQIYPVIAQTLAQSTCQLVDNIDDILQCDEQARQIASQIVNAM